MLQQVLQAALKKTLPWTLQSCRSETDPRIG